jgi:membrane-associated phospholipid phosphatase
VVSENPSRLRRLVSSLRFRGSTALPRRAWPINLYFLFPVAYAAVLLAYYALDGDILQFLPGVFFLGAVPVLAVLGLRGVAKYWTPFVMLLLSYEALAGTVGALSASKGVYSLFGLDNWMFGFNLTGWIQSALMSAPVTLVATVFYELHMPLIVFTTVVLWYWRRAFFGGYVTAMVLTSYLALITFILVPTSPPWFVGAAKDLVLGSGSIANTGIAGAATALIEADQFAAFPSLHAAYAVIFSYFMFKVSRKAGYLSLIVSGGILFSTLYLGQHYVIDLVAGAAFALVPCLLSERYQLLKVKEADLGRRPA